MKRWRYYARAAAHRKYRLNARNPLRDDVDSAADYAIWSAIRTFKDETGDPDTLDARFKALLGKCVSNKIKDTLKVHSRVAFSNVHRHHSGPRQHEATGDDASLCNPALPTKSDWHPSRRRRYYGRDDPPYIDRDAECYATHSRFFEQHESVEEIAEVLGLRRLDVEFYLRQDPGQFAAWFNGDAGVFEDVSYPEREPEAERPPRRHRHRSAA